MEEQWSRLRHDLRSAFNNVRLCVAAFETEEDAAEQVQWMNYVEKAADKCLATLDQIEQLADSAPTRT
jgi:hypothetical protein